MPLEKTIPTPTTGSLVLVTSLGPLNSHGFPSKFSALPIKDITKIKNNKILVSTMLPVKTFTFRLRNGDAYGSNTRSMGWGSLFSSLDSSA
jgi:hypothetical protein